MHVQIENRKQYRIETWHVVLTTLMLAGAIYSAFEHLWPYVFLFLCNSISWMMMPRRNSACLVSAITINESSLVIAYRTSKQKVITLDELREIQNSEHTVLIRIYRDKETQELELKRSEFDEDSWQQILQLKNQLSGSP